MRTVYYRGYVLEWDEHQSSWRICKEEDQKSTIAYEDHLDEAKRRLDEQPNLYCGSEDGYEVEYCSNCENEVEIRWDINKMGFQAWCPVCGARMMLCDACAHRFGEWIGDCDRSFHQLILQRRNSCRFRRPDDWWKQYMDDDEEKDEQE